MNQPQNEAPAWTQDEKNQMLNKMVELAQKVPTEHPLIPVEQRPIDAFTTFFADWELKGDDVLFHFYPRAGAEDKWTTGHYEPHCASCGASVDVPKTRRELKPCPRCSHTGLRYIPGRTEQPGLTAEFPSDMKERLKKAVDNLWMGEVAIDYVPELKSFVVQLQKASTSAKVFGYEQFADKLCSKVDELLDV
jgi:DNA-directed RNA polymerase subunit RPC12/RpoP